MSFGRDKKNESAIREAVIKEHAEIIKRINERSDYDKDKREREVRKQKHRMEIDIEFQLYYGPKPDFDPEKQWSKKRDDYMHKKMRDVFMDDPTLLSDEEVHSKYIATCVGSDEDFKFWREIDQIRRGNPEAPWELFNQTFDQRNNPKYQEKMAEEREKTLARQAQFKKIWGERCAGLAVATSPVKEIKEASKPKVDVEAESDESVFGFMRKVLCGRWSR